MHGVWEIAVGTIVSRPYVFAFFAAYLLAAIPHLGWRKVALFTPIGYLIAFLSEVSSINTGFPYGWYYYIDKTSSRELWLAGVPFFDSLSYVFLCYCSYSVALLILSPLKTGRHTLAILETHAIRRSFPALLLGSLLQTYLDIIIDPVSLQGERWFLGQIYGYREVGWHFGVPLSNYLGWWLTSALMIRALQMLDRLVPEEQGFRSRYHRLPGSPLFGPALYLSVVIFNLTIAAIIGERQIAITGLFIALLPLTMVVVLGLQRANRYGEDELRQHRLDFYDPP
jgi:putative membrane protein